MSDNNEKEAAHQDTDTKSQTLMDKLIPYMNAIDSNDPEYPQAHSNYLEMTTMVVNTIRSFYRCASSPGIDGKISKAIIDAAHDIDKIFGTVVIRTQIDRIEMSAIDPKVASEKRKKAAIEKHLHEVLIQQRKNPIHYSFDTIVGKRYGFGAFSSNDATEYETFHYEFYEDNSKYRIVEPKTIPMHARLAEISDLHTTMTESDLALLFFKSVSVIRGNIRQLLFS